MPRNRDHPHFPRNLNLPGTCIVDPNGLVAAEAATLGDELVVADCDLDACRQGKEKMFNFAAHRRPQWYGRIVEQVGATPPA